MIAGKLLFDFYFVIQITGNLLFDFYSVYFVILTGSLLQRNLAQFLKAVLSNFSIIFSKAVQSEQLFFMLHAGYIVGFISLFFWPICLFVLCVSIMNKSEKSKPFQWYHICLVHKNPVTSSYRVCPLRLSFWSVCWDCPCSVKAFFQAGGYSSSSFFKLSRHLFYMVLSTLSSLL